MKAKFREQLKTAGYSITQSREAVFDILRSGALSMPELKVRLTGKLDRASLYRVLALFEELQIVQIVGQGSNRRVELSDRYNSHHHHLNCIICGGFETVEAPTIERELTVLALKYGFQSSSHQLEINGVCRSCAVGS
jgi:Fe2+ or Zn2+ uptake regulation protein